ncbi:MAG: hypothetical protein JJT94_10290 [Bernardetiaceae bacterium]|nr:hypothetical protein [Bernardetiaceae bacterium]
MLIIEQTARLVSATDYYPFGMAIHSRSWQSEGYRFGFNGKENNIEILYRHLLKKNFEYNR